MYLMDFKRWKQEKNYSVNDLIFFIFIIKRSKAILFFKIKKKKIIKKKIKNYGKL